jgi:site-specific DNA-methyltransferase (adenine-specific)
MKPLDGTFAQNAEKWGVGGLWIDGGRIGINAEVDDPRLGGKGKWFSTKKSKIVYKGGWAGKEVGSSELGRWPANLILDEEAGRMLDEQSGVCGGDKRKSKSTYDKGIWGNAKPVQSEALYNDSGGASRFFYTAKASRSEREKENKHPTVKPLSLIKYLCKLTRTPKGGIVLDPFGGSGTTALACIRTHRKYILIEKELKSCKIAKERLNKLKTNVPISLQRKGFKGLLG